MTRINSSVPRAAQAPEAELDSGKQKPEETSGHGWPVRRLLLGILLLLVAGGAYPAYRWFHAYRTAQYKSACVRAVADERWAELNTVASRWIEWDPSSNDAWVYVAEAAVQAGKPEEAAQALGRVSDSYQGALQALALRGEILFGDLNRPFEAAETWQRMLRINPYAALAHQRLIYFYAMTLQRKELVEQIESAIQNKCEPPEAYSYYLLAYELNFSDGLRVITRWRQNHPENELLEIAQACYAARNTEGKGQALFGEATVAPGDRSLIDACLVKFPENLEVLAFHIDQAIYDGEDARVAELLERAPAEAESDPRFWRSRAWYLSSIGKHEEARIALHEALMLHPVDWRSRWTLADVLRRLQRPAEAAEAAEIAVEGKELHRKLFEMPNAASLDESMGQRILGLLRRTGPALVQQGLERRL